MGCRSQIQAKAFAGHDPTKLIVRLLDFFRYFLTIVSSAFTVSTLLSKNAKTLIVLNMLKAFAHLYRLVAAYCIPNSGRKLISSWL